MAELQAVLKELFERSSYGTIKELAQAAQAYTPISASYLTHILSGRRQNPTEDKLRAIARALELNEQDTYRLLEAAGIQTIDPEMQRVVAALQTLADTPGLSTRAFKKVIDGLLLLIEGFKDSLAASPLPTQSEVALHLPTLPETLPPDVAELDDLLGEILTAYQQDPLAMLFHSLEEAARGDRWEVKRRLAEALPKLVQLQPEAALRLAGILRKDYHPDYRADIRRRVIEAVPALYLQRPDAALDLLVSRPNDEVYMAMAAVEVLHDLERSGQLSPETAEHYFQALQVEEAEPQEAVAFLHQLLREAQTDPDAALATMNARRTDPERLIRICIQRIVPRLLDRRPEPALDLMLYFLRTDENGQPAEHQNLRRPVSKALPDVLDLMSKPTPAIAAKIERLLRALADDPDIHVRRALSDALGRLAVISAQLSIAVLNSLLQDKDPYVRQRAWRVMLQLDELYPEQAAEYYAHLLTPAA